MKHWINKWFLEHQCDASTSLSKKKKKTLVADLVGWSAASSAPVRPLPSLLSSFSPLLSLPLLASLLGVLRACATAVPDLVLSLSELRRSVEEEWISVSFLCFLYLLFSAWARRLAWLKALLGFSRRWRSGVSLRVLVRYGFSVAVSVRGGESSALSTTASSFGGGTFRACLFQGHGLGLPPVHFDSRWCLICGGSWWFLLQIKLDLV
ncbi:hypothetical protein DY000_02034202 [Brassica cretica]|uniref:Uncharacterized protein n=1 Tax=Brassica cretica TaxID=69181 RepID=A0ABQ7DRG6_BRACR|nr:hypothetical protein DY000_02034202 [Brassica cretica]